MSPVPGDGSSAAIGNVGRSRCRPVKCSARITSGTVRWLTTRAHGYAKPSVAWMASRSSRRSARPGATPGGVGDRGVGAVRHRGDGGAGVVIVTPMLAAIVVRAVQLHLRFDANRSGSRRPRRRSRFSRSAELNLLYSPRSRPRSMSRAGERPFHQKRAASVNSLASEFSYMSQSSAQSIS